MLIAVIPIAVSAAALILSLYIFFDNRRQDRRNVLLKMHELLVGDDLQRGRYLLFEKVIDEASVQSLSGQDYRDINRALATYNLLGLYVKNRYVEARDVLDVWDRSIYRTWVAGQPFLAHREHDHGYKVGVYFEQLAQKAADHLVLKGESLDVKIWRRPAEHE
jgi:hypothetical protein